MAEEKVRVYLSQLGIVCHYKLGIVVCSHNSCEAPLSHLSVWSHYWQHRHWSPAMAPKPPTRNVLIQWLTRLHLDKPCNDYVGQRMVAPIGVRVYANAIKCTSVVCHSKRQIFGAESSYRRLAQDHPTQLRQCCTVDAFPTAINTAERNYIQVLSSEVADGANQISRMVNKMLTSHLEVLKDERRTSVYRGYDNPRQARTWEYFLQWSNRLEGLVLHDLRCLIKIPDSKDPLFPLVEVSQIYYEAYSALIPRLPNDVRQHFGSTEKDNRTKLLNVLIPTSVTAYSRTMVQMLSLFFRLLAHPEPKYPHFLDETHQQALQNLENAIRSPAETLEHRTSLFHRAVKTLTSHRSKEFTLNPKASPFYVFQIINALNKNGNFLEAIEVTHRIAQIQWTVRTTWVAEFFLRREEEPETPPMMQVYHQVLGLAFI